MELSYEPPSWASLPLSEEWKLEVLKSGQILGKIDLCNTGTSYVTFGNIL